MVYLFYFYVLIVLWGGWEVGVDWEIKIVMFGYGIFCCGGCFFEEYKVFGDW